MSPRVPHVDDRAPIRAGFRMILAAEVLAYESGLVSPGS